MCHMRIRRKYASSKHNSMLEKQIVLFVTPNENIWHYLAITKLSSLLKGITSKHLGDFYLNRLYYFATGNKLKSQEDVKKNIK